MKLETVKTMINEGVTEGYNICINLYGDSSFTIDDLKHCILKEIMSSEITHSWITQGLIEELKAWGRSDDDDVVTEMMHPNNNFTNAYDKLRNLMKDRIKKGIVNGYQINNSTIKNTEVISSCILDKLDDLLTHLE